MAIADDFSVAANGDIRDDSPTQTYSVLEFHRYLQDLADDAAASGDDLLDITDATPSERSTDNIITLLNGYNIDDTTATWLYDGSITQDDGDTIYAGLVVVGSLASGNVEIIQNNALLTDTWTANLNADATQNIIMRNLVKVRTGGSDTDGKRLRVQSRTFGYTYDEFAINGTSLGNNVAALSTTSDLNNQTAQGTVNAWSITNTEGFQALDIDADGSTENYYSQWDRGAQTVNDVYEFAKDIMRDGTAETIHGISGSLFRGITHSVTYTSASGDFTEDETLSWGSGTTAGTGLLLADEDNGTSGTFYIQLLTGAVPTTTITGGTSTETATTGTVTAKTVSKPSFVGTSTGSNIIGAYGIGYKADTVGSSDTFTDLDSATITPPNNQDLVVASVVLGEDYILVTSYDGATTDTNGDPTPEYDQLTLATNLTGGTETSVVVSESIPADTPSSGTIRVVNDEGYHVKIAYSSWTGSTFTITSSDFSGSGATDAATTGGSATVYITYLDLLATDTSETVSLKYASDRSLVVRVRDGDSTPIKTFVTTATFGSSGVTVNAIRTSDA